MGATYDGRGGSGVQLTALVTGSAGFIGSHLVPRLRELGYRLTLVDPESESGMTFQEWLCAFNHARFDVVIHLAASLTKTDIEQRNKLCVRDAFSDIMLDYNMASYLERCPPRRHAIWLSSCAVDAHGCENYAFVKYVGERFATKLRQAGLPITILRPYAGYGPGQSLHYPLPAILARAMRREDPLTVWGSLNTTRDWIYIDDLVDAILYEVETRLIPVTSPVLVGTGRATTFGELARLMARAIPYDPVIVSDHSKPIGSDYRVCPFVRPVKVSLEDGIQLCLEAMKREVSKTA